LIPASVALASNPSSRSGRLTTFQRIFDKIPSGGSLSQRSADSASVSNENLYSNDDIHKFLDGAIAVSAELGG
jgi:hypothetical protein